MITEEQQAVIETSKRMQPQETLKIEACAGSGKTSALIEIAKSNPDKRFLYLAFNKAIVEEAKKRFPPNVRIFTTHGLAWKWYAYTYGTKDLVNIKGGYNVFDLKELFPDASYHELSSLISKFRNFCYSAEIVSHDQGVRKIFEAVKSGKLSMTHDFYLKLYQIEYTNRFKNYEYVLLDEAQDTNPVTMALFTDNNCRRILVGDSHQSIYGFRGAFNALERAVADTTLHLSYSFRSVQSVLDRANYFLQRFSLYKENFVPMKSKVEREYDPTVQDASKVNTLPVIKEPVVKKMAIDYATFTVPADPEKEISLLPSGNIMTDIQYNKRRGYFNFGGGTYLNLNGDLGYHILSTDKDKLNIWFSHRSTNGKVKYIDTDFDKVKAKLNDNLGGLNFKHAFEKLSLDMGIKYGYSAFNYYGLPVYSPESSVTLVPENFDRETNQVNQTIQAKIGVESKEDAPVGYLLDLGYTNFSHKYALSKEQDGPTEHTFDVKFDLNARFGGEQRIGLGGNVEYFNYSLPTMGGQEYLEFENHAEATLSPYYKVSGDNWNLKLGANIMFVTGDNSKFMASPNITADVEVADKTELYLVAGSTALRMVSL